MIAFLGLLIWTGYALITNATRRPPAARSTPRSTSGCEARLHLAGLLAAEPHATAARRLELEREAARLTRQTAPHTDVTVSFSKSISVLHASIRENARQARQAGDEDRAAWWDAREQEAARDQTPARLPASEIDPEARRALLRTSRRSLQMVLRLLAHNAEHWLSRHLSAYLCEDDEYRAITRETIIRGLAGVITYTPDAITVQLEEPGAPRVTGALRLLLDEINQAPPSLPGDPRPLSIQQLTHSNFRRSEPAA
jgi:hypothetical protein